MGFSGCKPYMEFWGIEVKPGEPIPIYASADNLVHLSQASLGESEKIAIEKENSVFLYVRTCFEDPCQFGTLSCRTLG